MSLLKRVSRRIRVRRGRQATKLWKWKYKKSKKTAAKNKGNGRFESQLFSAADKLRKNIDAAEYKHIVLGLIFLKYISDSFEILHSKLSAGEGEHAGANPEDPDEYRAENVFWVPPAARWSYLHARAKQPSIGKDEVLDQVPVGAAMHGRRQQGTRQTRMDQDRKR